MNPLVEAIADALAFVNAHPDPLQDFEVEQFCEIAERVCNLLPDSLKRHLPQVEGLRPVLESRDPPLPPVQFISKLNLPGDGTIGGFQVEATPWLAGMQKLHRLAAAAAVLEAENFAQFSEPPPLTPEDAAILKVLQAGVVTMTVDKIAAKVRFTDKTIRTRLEKLRASELVCEPEKRKGYTTTAKGAAAAKNLPDDAGAGLIRSERAGR